MKVDESRMRLAAVVLVLVALTVAAAAGYWFGVIVSRM